MKLLWLDLETTGLDPARHSILEVAAAVADLSSPLDIGPMLHAVLRVPIDAEATTVVRESSAAQPVTIDIGPGIEIDPVAREMHERSGLLAECAAASADLWTFRKCLLDMALGATADGEPPILAGSSVHFDRAFLKVHMPRVEAALSYRNYDARTIQLFCRSLGMPSQPKAGAHRAVADILESIEHVRACMRWLGREPIVAPSACAEDDLDLPGGAAGGVVARRHRKPTTAAERSRARVRFTFQAVEDLPAQDGDK